jgi:hypothetical protein
MTVAVAMAWLFAAYLTNVATGRVMWFNEMTLLVNWMTPTFSEDT